MNTFDLITLLCVGLGCGVLGLLVGCLIGSGVDRYADYIESDRPLILDDDEKTFFGIDMGSPEGDRHVFPDSEKRHGHNCL